MFPWYLHEAAAPDFCLEVGFQFVRYISKISFREESKEEKKMGKKKQQLGKRNKSEEKRRGHVTYWRKIRTRETEQNIWERTSSNDHPSLQIVLGTIGVGQ